MCELDHNNGYFLSTEKLSVLVKNWNENDVIMSDVKEYLHSWESLVAEFGGSLGLFLGFSFISLWGWLQAGIGHLRQLKLFSKVKIVKTNEQ